ncbi:hypothetical protein LEMLEM_LOCUS14793 [Lemmus lemmus]
MQQGHSLGGSDVVDADPGSTPHAWHYLPGAPMGGCV